MARKADESVTATPSVSLPKTRIAVLPFKNMGQEKGDDYLAEGITEEMINSLSNFHELKVIARTSIVRYKDTTKSVSEIGREMNVGSVLEGSVRKVGNRVRVITQLIDVSSEDHIWSERYDLKLDNVILVQCEIAEKVAAILKLKLLATEKERLKKTATESSDAYVSYLKGRDMLQKDRTEENLRAASDFFQRASTQDSKYAKAYAGLAESHFLLGWYLYVPKDEALVKAHAAVKTAFSIDNDLAEAHSSYGNLLLMDYKFDQAEAEFKRAIALNPSDSFAHRGYLACLGDTYRFEEAVLQAKLLEDADPLSAVNSVNLSVLYSYLGMKNDSSNVIRKIESLDPGSPWVDWGEAVEEIWNLNFASAAEHLEDFMRKRPEDFERLGVLGYVYGRGGRDADASRVVDQLKVLSANHASGAAFSFAKVYCGLGEKDLLFNSLERAFQERSLVFRWLSYLKMEELMEADDRYLNILRKVGLLQGALEGQTSSSLPKQGTSWDLSLWVSRFADPRTKQVFDYLIGAFIQDEFIDKLPVEKSGWRTLGDISQKTGITKSQLYGYPSGSGIVLKDLISSKVAELKSFEGERGRGGDVTRVRIAYEKDEEIRRFIAHQFRNKAISTDKRL